MCRAHGGSVVSDDMVQSPMSQVTREVFLFNTGKEQHINSIDIVHFIKDSLVDYKKGENFKLITTGEKYGFRSIKTFNITIFSSS